MSQITVEQIANLVNGEVSGHSAEEISGIASIDKASKGDLTFLARKKYISFLQKTNASAVLLDYSIDCSLSDKTIIRVPNASSALDAIILEFFSDQDESFSGISDQAFIGENVKLGKNVKIYPFVCIGNNAEIGDNTVINSNSVIGSNVKIGSFCKIYPNVSILNRVVLHSNVIIHSGTVIGSDGFGYEVENGIPKKIPQIGTVVIEDDVEIGSNVSIDRARLDQTSIRKGTKIDNLVHIAHNAEIGEHSMILGQAGIAGSCILGKRVIMAGQTGLTGHITIGDGVTITSKAGVTKSVPEGKIMSGFPANEHLKYKRVTVSLYRVPELIKQVSRLQKQVLELETKIGFKNDYEKSENNC